MTKKCIGCGIELQDQDILKDGFTPKLTNDLCQRCFKIKHYGDNKKTNIKISNDSLTKDINQKKALVVFVVDFLNIYQSIIDLYNKITCKKILVITKSDIIPRNIIKDKLIDNIKRVYNIKDNVYITSIYNNYNIEVLKNIIKGEKQVVFAGFTNAGKSSLINKLTIGTLTVSKKANTTLDFVKVKFEDTIIYDAPGFIDDYFYDALIANKEIKPKTYQLQNKYYLLFNNINVSMNIDNNISLYMNNNIDVSKRKKINDFDNKIEVLDNSDLIIKGLGFINIKKKCNVYINIPKDFIDIRESIVGGNHE